MARSWAQLLGEENAQPEPEDDRAGLFSRLRDSLSKSRRALTAELASAAFDPGDAAAWEACCQYGATVAQTEPAKPTSSSGCLTALVAVSGTLILGTSART